MTAKQNPTPRTDVNAAHPDDLEDQADELEIEARRLRQRARRMRRDGSPSVAFLDAATVEREYPGLKMSVVTAAARRHELVIGRAGRSPVVTRAALDAWITTRKHPLSKPLPVDAGDDAASLYEEIARRAG